MKLSDKIWITRKSRIEASNRLDWNAAISQLLLTYYSVFLLVLTIIDLRDVDHDYSFQLLIASVIVLSVSIFVIGVKYKERALAFKVCYVCLDKLSRKAQKEEDSPHKNSQSILEKIEIDYFEILALSENHTDCDYLLAKYRIHQQQTNDFKLTIDEWGKLIVFKSLRVILFAILFTFPFYFWYSGINEYTIQIPTTVLR